MGNSAPECRYKNQGETIDGLKNEINTGVNNSKNDLYYINNDSEYGLNNYFSLILSLYGGSSNSYDNDYDNDVSKYPNTTNNHFINVLGNNEYYFNNDFLKGSIQNYYDTSMNHTKDFNGKIKEINELLARIKEKYGSIDDLINTHDSQIKDINIIKGNIVNQSYSVSFFENLLIQSYKHLYDAIYTENKVLLNNKSIKFDMYSTDNSRYLYEIDKVKFYENINTFLFYFYYLLIIIFLVVVLKYNYTSILLKLTFFRIFAVLLILYPLFILRIQDYIYKLFGYLYSFHIFDINVKNQPLDINIKPK